MDLPSLDGARLAVFFSLLPMFVLRQAKLAKHVC